MVDFMLQSAFYRWIGFCQKRKFVDDQHNPFSDCTLPADIGKGIRPVRKRCNKRAGEKPLYHFGKIIQIQTVILFLRSKEDQLFVRCKLL